MSGAGLSDSGLSESGLSESGLSEPGVVDAAVLTSEAAARAVGVVVREVADIADLHEVSDLFARIWAGDAPPPISIELMRAFAKAGNYVAGAYAGERLVGACVGFFHAPREDTLHSHVAGVDRGLPGRGVGYALKLHQRAWTLSRGVSRIVWTYDPLVGRNAYFNLVKLGARPVEYLTDFYGPMLDSINATDESDRLLVRWEIAGSVAVAAVQGTGTTVSYEQELAGGAVVALGIGTDGEPVEGRLKGSRLLVATPRDIETLRGADVEAGRRWRRAVRDTLGVLMDAGGRVIGFDRAGWYVVETA